MAIDNSTQQAKAESPAESSGNANQGHGKGPLIILLLLLLLAGGAAWFFLGKKPESTEGILQTSGRIEGYETDLGAKIGGRVEQVIQREGELVKKGDLVAQISDDDIQAQLREDLANIEKAKEQVESQQDKLDVLESQIKQSELKISQSKEDSLGRIRQWESNVATNEAMLSQAQSELIKSEADLELAKTRKDRYQFLVSKEAVTRDEYDQVVNTYQTEKALVEARKASVKASEKELKAAHAQLAVAQSSRLNPQIEMAQKISLQKQFLQAKHELRQAEAEVASKIAQRDQTKANIAYLKIESPLDGVITARAVEPGAVVTAGQTIVSVINLSQVYLRAYIPEAEIGRVKIGQNAKVFLDAFPKKPFEGRVSQVDPEGSFTPENIYFKNDRVKQVFGIKISIQEPGGLAKPGMPADAQLILD